MSLPARQNKDQAEAHTRGEHADKTSDLEVWTVSLSGRMTDCNTVRSCRFSRVGPTSGPWGK